MRHGGGGWFRDGRGSGDAFGALYALYAVPLRQFVRRLLGDDEDAADVTHDVFLRAYTRIAEVRQPERVRSWLFCVARNAAIDHLRRRTLCAGLGVEQAGRRGGVSAGDVDCDAPDLRVARAEMRALVWEIAAGLSPRSAAMLDRSFRRCQDTGLIAAALGTTSGNVYVMLSRARSDFRHAAATYALLRSASDSCRDLHAAAVAADVRPYSRLVRAAVERHADRCADCDACRRRFADPAVVRATLDDLAPIGAV